MKHKVKRKWDLYGGETPVVYYRCKCGWESTKYSSHWSGKDEALKDEVYSHFKTAGYIDDRNY